VGEVHQQHQLDQDEAKSPPRAHHKPRCNHRHTAHSVTPLVLQQLCILEVILNVEKEILTVGERPIWNIKGANCNCHQGSKLKEPESDHRVGCTYTYI